MSNSYKSLAAAQALREDLGIISETYATLTGNIDGKDYEIKITLSHNAVKFFFDEETIHGFSEFSTLFQVMDWNSSKQELNISSDKPKYSFTIKF
ncbi:hypothetical protein [Serratia fonticola]|uniref:hypothetical protein n=1 Tax=Serratia fonticola TaxID=47917 RepID=UPI00192AFC46|nr:hypothetical protein [Serratia fonticola]MBL5904439.1 hypothetical protein [Serratia fonticola]